jgi:pimeloyl-ACP methyl ester carboxylesterase
MIVKNSPVNLTEMSLERKGCRIHYWLGGAEEKPLVVFTHGACVDHRTFDLQIPVIGQYFKVLTWDVRGHGLSQPSAEEFNLRLAAEDLLALLDHLGYGKAILVGHSNGSYISQEVAYSFPERVQAIVVVDGTCITWRRNPLEKWVVQASGRVMNLMPFETLKTAGLHMFSKKKEVRDYIYDAFSLLKKRDYITIWNGSTGCLRDDPEYTIQQPFLLTHGDGDRTGDIRKIAPAWAAKSPNCTYLVIPNALHMAPMDNPEFFNQQLLEFLNAIIKNTHP